MLEHACIGLPQHQRKFIHCASDRDAFNETLQLLFSDIISLQDIGRRHLPFDENDLGRKDPLRDRGTPSR